MLSAKTNGAVIYRGPSQLDGAPILVIVTGLASGSTNVKTGSLLQTWILREDVSPIEAIHSGADASICGACPHRGRIEDGRNVGRSCYVQVFQAPRNVWQTERKGAYPQLSLSDLPQLGEGRRVRLGAYGDPAAVPFEVWAALLSRADAWTGYTHQWRVVSSDLSRYVMASCDTPADYLDAKAAGWRTFRVRTSGEVLNAKEIVCPASKEAGVKTNCAACVACGGHGAKARADVAIIAHGSAAITNNYDRLRAA